MGLSLFFFPVLPGNLLAAPSLLFLILIYFFDLPQLLQIDDDGGVEEVERRFKRLERLEAMRDDTLGGVDKTHAANALLAQMQDSTGQNPYKEVLADMILAIHDGSKNQEGYGDFKFENLNKQGAVIKWCRRIYQIFLAGLLYNMFEITNLSFKNMVEFVSKIVLFPRQFTVLFLGQLTPV